MPKVWAILIAVVLWAAPYPAHAVSPQHPRHTEAKGSAAIETRGTETAPIFVKIAPAEKSKADIAREEAKEKEALNIETRLANLTGDLASYTFWLFIATAILAAITALLVWLGFMQAADNKRSIKASEAAAKAAQDQVELGRDEFNATHRPQLEVRFVREVSGSVEMTVINTGTSAAKFFFATAILRRLQDGAPLPSPHEIPLAGSFVLPDIFAPSVSYTHTVTNFGDDFEDGFGSPIHIFGYIIYDTIGPNPVRRTTYFGRKSVLFQPELVPIEGSDWNLIQ